MSVKCLRIQFIKNSEITKDSFNQIINLKRKHWDYSYDEHKRWMEENLNENDYHIVIFRESDEVIAYLNVVNTFITIETTKEKVLGVGNVCVDKSVAGQGVGTLLMCSCNYLIRNINTRAILLCRRHLVNFYRKSGWIEYEGITLLGNSIFPETVMVTRHLEPNQIELDRSF